MHMPVAAYAKKEQPEPPGVPERVVQSATQHQAYVWPEKASFMGFSISMATARPCKTAPRPFAPWARETIEGPGIHVPIVRQEPRKPH